MVKGFFSPLLKVATVFSMAVTFTVSSFSGVAGAEGQPTGPATHLTSMVESFNEQTEVVSKDQEKELVKVTKKYLKSDSVLVSMEHSELDFNDVLVRSLENGEFFVKVALKGETAVEKFNGVSLTINSDQTVTSTFEVSLKETSNDTAELKTWMNGEVVSDVQLSKPDVEPQWSWSYFNDCLSSQGIAWAVIAALGVVCGGLCLVTAGAACVGCLYAGASGSGGTIGWCIGQALKR